MLKAFQDIASDQREPETAAAAEHYGSGLDLGRIIEAIPAWVQVCGLDGTIQMVNQAATRLSGYERHEMEGQTWPYPWFAESEAASGYSRGWGTHRWPYAELERSGHIPEFEVVYTTPQGHTRVLGVSLTLVGDDLDRPRHVLMVAWDHTQHRTREAELARAHKIQAVNQLAAGIAHDINNNLAVVLGYSEFLLSTSESFGDVVRQALAAIRDQSIECANTVRRIQLFSRTVRQSQLSDFSVNDAVEDVVAATRGLWQDQPREKGIDIRIETDLADLGPVLAYEPGFKEVLTGVVDNAVDALPQGGVISVKTREIPPDSHLPKGGRGGILVEVKDNGVGIPQTELGRVFDAFYTTKGPANSGLGLSIAYSLITQQGGDISVSSREGQGTTVAITLPCRAAAAGRDGDRLLPGEKRGLSILVVEDEPLVADVFRTFLETFGHQVVACLTGADALELFDRRDFDLALVDLGMPEMDGWEVSRRINRLRPDFPIIVATGWNVSVEDGVEQGAQVRAVLKKPFGMYGLDRAVQEALG